MTSRREELLDFVAAAMENVKHHMSDEEIEEVASYIEEASGMDLAIFTVALTNEFSGNAFSCEGGEA
jgi:cytochrome c553